MIDTPTISEVTTLPSEELASVTSVAYHLGEIMPIDKLDFLQDDPQKLRLYRMAGFEYYAESDLSMRELAYRSAIQSLEACDISLEDIGICLYVAESFDRDEPVNSSEVNHLLLDLGLENTVPIHISISNCANIVTALRVATTMVKAGETDHVLIVSVDKASRRFGGRKMFQEMSVKSDISLSCLVSRPCTGNYGLQYLNQQNNASLIDADLMDSASYAMMKFKSIRRVAKKARDALRLQPTDFKRIVTNNYSKGVTKMFIELCGFPTEVGCFGNIGRFAHAVAGDVLINLSDLEEDGVITSGDRIFLMSDSITSSSVVCLQRR